MEDVYIPLDRIKLLRQKPALLAKMGKISGCGIKLGDGNYVEIEGESYNIYVATEAIRAFGRGFDMKTAEMLLRDGYYFSYLDIKDIARSKKRAINIKSRLIGSEGRAKKYIERVSGAHVSIYGDTVSFIGSTEALAEAETAAKTIIEGGSHRLAYSRMEAAHRKHKNSRFAEV